MIKIDQDTFRNNKLYFGSRDSKQRKDYQQWRLSKVKDIIYEYFPEYSLFLEGDEAVVDYYISRLRHLNDFKFRYKLAYSLSLKSDYMESVTTNEFNRIIYKFKNYIHHNKNSSDLKFKMKNIFLEGKKPMNGHRFYW